MQRWMTTSVARSILCAALATGASPLAACSGDSPTRIVVALDSDLPKDALSHVRLETFDLETDQRADEHTFVLGARDSLAEHDGEVELPFAIGIRKGRDDDLRIVVTGLKDGKTVIERRVHASFSPGRTVYLPLYFAASCRGVVCESGREECYPQTVGNVEAGQCGAVRELATSRTDPRDRDGHFRFEAGSPENAPDGGTEKMPDGTADDPGPADTPDGGSNDVSGGAGDSADDASAVATADGSSEDCGDRCAPQLTSLTLTAGTLVPAFDPSVETYQLKVASWQSGIAIAATGDEGAAVKVGDEVMGEDGVWEELEEGENAFEILVEAEGMSRSYGLTIERREPVEHYLKAPIPKSRQGFGGSISLSEEGRTLIVGAAREDQNAGSAYVLDSVSSSWGAPLLVSRGASEWDQHGSAVALSADGHTLAVGSPGESSPWSEQVGKVYIYTRTGGAWGPPVRLQPSGLSERAQFGERIALSADGNVLATGAGGATYVLRREGGTWSPATRLDPSLPTGDPFPMDLALDGHGTTLVVGDGTSARVYTYTRNADGSWKNGPILDYGGDELGPGNAVAISRDGSSLAVGAAFEKEAAGAVYVYERSDTGWGAPERLESTATASPYYGIQLAFNARATLLSVSSFGTAYVLARHAGTWREIGRRRASNGDTADTFGTAIKLNGHGTTLAVGASTEQSCEPADRSNDFCSEAGAVYIFE